MRFLTFNLHGWQTATGEQNLDHVTDLLEQSQAEVIGLNEVWHPLRLMGTESALDVLAGRLRMFYAFGLVAPALTADKVSLPYGNALLSRWQIVAYAAHRLPAGSYGVPRGLLEARLALPGERRFTVYVTHLDHRSEPARLQQWEAAQSWLRRERSQPHVVMGDFNALAASDYGNPAALDALQSQHAQRGWPPPVFELTESVLRAGYRDAFAGHGHGPGSTWPAHEPERRVDYIFVPAGSPAVVSCCRWDGLGAGTASDHRPVLADLE